jgi:hypothetical protein
MMWRALSVKPYLLLGYADIGCTGEALSSGERGGRAPAPWGRVWPMLFAMSHDATKLNKRGFTMLVGGSARGIV